MNDAETRAALVRHWPDIANQAIVYEIYDDEVVLEFPQGNERLVGLANVRAMREAYPAIVSATIQRLRGGGALWVAELLPTYDGAQPTHTVNVMEFVDGKVRHETIYYGAPWDAPAWRPQWVEAIGPRSSDAGTGVTG